MQPLRRIIMVTCLTLAALGSLAPALAEEPHRLKVMSFNIRCDNAGDGDDGWAFRKAFLVETIRAAAPDLLGLQEVLAHQGDYVKEHLADYGYVGTGRDDADRRGEASPILYRRDRFDLIDSGQYWLSETPDDVGSKGWDADIPRIATWARLRDRAAGRELLYVNTHWDHRGETARVESARLMLRRAAATREGLPVLITGDFNATEAMEPYRILTSDASLQLIDAYRTLHPRPAADEATYHGFEGVREGQRIDWILHTADWTPATSAIDRTQRDGRYPSDHFPVTAELVWR